MSYKCDSLIVGSYDPVNRDTRPMSTTREHRQQVAAAVLLIGLLAPLAPLMAWHFEDGMPNCADDAAARCAGLWSAACCDFASPPRPTDGVPGGFDADTSGAPVRVVHSDALLPSVSHTPLALDFLLEDRAGPPPPRLLTSVLLI